MDKIAEWTAQPAMFIFDITFVFLFICLAVYWKEQRLGLLSVSALYLTFSLLWHLL